MLLAQHGKRLLELVGDFNLDCLPLADYSRRALDIAKQRQDDVSGSQPSHGVGGSDARASQPSEGIDSLPTNIVVSYKELFAGDKFFFLCTWHTGRKPPGSVHEADATDAENERLKRKELGIERPRDWAKWWMDLGGFKTPEQLDSNNWSALHHAIDATSYSWRAMEAAVELVCITPTWVINTQTAGSQPRGSSCLHVACDGSDKTFRRVRLACALLKKELTLRREVVVTEHHCSWPAALARVTLPSS